MDARTARRAVWTDRVRAVHDGDLQAKEDTVISWNTWSTVSWPAGGHWAVQTVAGEPPLVLNDDDILTADELRERSHIEESDALLQSFISAARQQVERDTGLALPTQRIAVGYDVVDPSRIYLVPRPPLQDLTAVVYSDVNGGTTVIDTPYDLLVNLDRVSMPGRLLFKSDAFSAMPAPPGPMQALGLVVTAGWTKDTLPPLLKFAVGLLASHYLTLGRDLASIDQATEIPMGYSAAIQAYRLEVLV
jgi:uncharacterized phiE125 gp8 family phage protein